MLIPVLTLLLAARRTALLGGATLAVVGCDTGPGDATTVSYDFSLFAYGADTTAERIRSYDCFVRGAFQVPVPVAPTGTVHLPLRVTRNLTEYQGTHVENTTADSTIADAVLDYAGLGTDSVTFTLGAGPYVATLGPGGGVPTHVSENAGPWTCDAAVPLAQDSTLGAYGYDPNLEIQGTWRILEMIPIG